MTSEAKLCQSNTKPEMVQDLNQVVQEDVQRDLNETAPMQSDEVAGLSREEEASLIEASNSLKIRANALFVKAEFIEAITMYEEALARCPASHEYEAVVLKSNLAACYLKLENWKEAKKAATVAIDGLERLQNVETRTNTSEPGDHKGPDVATTREADLVRMQIKVLLRRAHANRELGGWAALQSALDDYQALSQMPALMPQDRALVQRQLTLLPPRTQAAQKAEMGQLVGQLKQLGNGLLKPFGLSTDNFQMQKDEKTGGYSMNFQPGSSS